MLSKKVGVALAFVASEALGLEMGWLYFRLFVKTIPPLSMSSVNSAAAQAACLTYGALAGIVIFLWTLLAVFLARFFKRPGRKPAL